MTILIAPDDTYMPQSRDVPIVGRTYTLEDASTGSNAQGRAFHALCHAYYDSGCWSYPGSGYKSGATFMEFRSIIKLHLGAGFESYAYIGERDGRPVIMTVDKWDDIPIEIRKNPNFRDLIRGRLKSWADYTKKERKDTIDALIKEMEQVGVNTPKYREILAGMEREEQTA